MNLNKFKETKHSACQSCQRPAGACGHPTRPLDSDGREEDHRVQVPAEARQVKALAAQCPWRKRGSSRLQACPGSGDLTQAQRRGPAAVWPPSSVFLPERYPGQATEPRPLRVQHGSDDAAGTVRRWEGPGTQGVELGPTQARVASAGSLNRAPGEWAVVTLQGCQDSSGKWEEIN